MQKWFSDFSGLNLLPKWMSVVVLQLRTSVLLSIFSGTGFSSVGVLSPKQQPCLLLMSSLLLGMHQDLCDVPTLTSGLSNWIKLKLIGHLH